MFENFLLRVCIPAGALVVSLAAILFSTDINPPNRTYKMPEELSYPSPEPIRSAGGLPLDKAAAAGTKPGWRLVFRDEFEGGQLDARIWHTEYWWGRINPPDAQYYAPDAFVLDGGLMRIKAEKRQMGDLAYTSGLISSHDLFTFTYGYAEARVKVPEGQGLWPAFWLLAADRQSASEIDVMEILGHEPQRTYAALHFRDAQGQPQGHGSSFAGPDFSRDFHTFAVDWSAIAVTWYVDDNARSSVTQDVPQEPMYMIANLAAGSVWSGYTDATTIFPAYYEIDYIRVYQR